MGKDWTTRINWREASVYAAAAGLSLVEPRGLRGWKRYAYWGAVSALTGATVLATEDDPFLTPPAALAGAGVTFGLMEPALKLDEWSVELVERAGVKHPRVLAAVLCLVAGAGAVVTGAMREPEEEILDDEAPEPVELDPRVRQIVAEMLAGIDDWGAVELREQFASARQAYPLTEDNSDWVDFVVDDDAPRAASNFYEFPVTGRGRVGDEEVVVTIIVDDGRLANLRCQNTDFEPAPLPEQLTYVVGARA